MDPQFSTKHAQFIREHPDVLTTGLVTEEQERRLERWVCEPCFEDFATEFGWVASTCYERPPATSATLTGDRFVHVL